MFRKHSRPICTIALQRNLAKKFNSDDEKSKEETTEETAQVKMYDSFKITCEKLGNFLVIYKKDKKEERKKKKELYKKKNESFKMCKLITKYLCDRAII